MIVYRHKGRIIFDVNDEEAKNIMFYAMLGAINTTPDHNFDQAAEIYRQISKVVDPPRKQVTINDD